ncbi:dihydrodipicolinate synthase family protein [Enterocloster citroniae]|uniref:4-hydroxy-tetrahydrodipicolinate synthase n=1 Tax=[Clostridium] citroniae WAL-17108 TaxID=742733 RepID=G5HDN6_9FIRM|nr:dihydrodipicolinate synthase family protein [Enterocloster citroniae]EHF00520.1 hypothetical protein HMPREF9469_00698 [ [[Clostridium] citroniae WAL-17108]
MRLKGIFPPMITPFKENGEVDYEAFTYNVKKWEKTDMDGLLVLGSNSETPFLREDEKLKLIELTVKYAGDKVVMCGTGMETAKDTIDLTNRAADLGADCALILTPCFYDAAMKTPALLEYYTTVADHVSIPILVYNVPKFTHVNVGADLISQLAKHPNIIGMKDSSGDMPQFATFKRVTAGEDFSIFVGTASALYPALALGAAGGILALANCNPEECVEVYKKYGKGDMEGALKTFQRVFPINTAVTATYGIAGLKHACTVQGYCGGFVRKPLMELANENKRAVEEILSTAKRPE